MKYFLVTFAMLLTARPITLSLSVIHRQSIQKKLGFLFTPIPIKGKLVNFFWGKWTRDFFECDGIHEISLLVLILLPFNLIMFVLILAYFVMVIIAFVTKNDAFMLFAYKDFGFFFAIYTMLLGICTTIFSYWAYIWKKPRVSIKMQKKALKEIDQALKVMKNQKWYYPLREEMFRISCVSNGEQGKYWFKTSEISRIKQLVNESSKNAILEVDSDGFTVLDSKSGNTVFHGLFQE